MSPKILKYLRDRNGPVADIINDLPEDDVKALLCGCVYVIASISQRAAPLPPPVSPSGVLLAMASAGADIGILTEDLAIKVHSAIYRNTTDFNLATAEPQGNGR